MDLSYQFATHLAVDHVNLTVAPGEMYGLLGPNGAGKTTTISMITTLLTPATGSVQVFGLDPAGTPDARPAGHRLRAAGAVRRREPDRRRERGAVRPALRRPTAPRAKQRVNEALEAMGLTEAADRLAGTYSGGMIRRLELAQSLISAPAAAGTRRADGRPRPDRPRRRLGVHRQAARSSTR